jgi:hypothetical protein
VLCGRLVTAKAERHKTLTGLTTTEPVVGAQLPRAQRLQWFLWESDWQERLVTNLPAPSQRAGSEPLLPAADLPEVMRLYGLRMWVEQSSKHVKHAASLVEVAGEKRQGHPARLPRKSSATAGVLASGTAGSERLAGTLDHAQTLLERLVASAPHHLRCRGCSTGLSGGRPSLSTVQLDPLSTKYR